MIFSPFVYFVAAPRIWFCRAAYMVLPRRVYGFAAPPLRFLKSRIAIFHIFPADFILRSSFALFRYSHAGITRNQGHALAGFVFLILNATNKRFVNAAPLDFQKFFVKNIQKNQKCATRNMLRPLIENF